MTSQRSRGWVPWVLVVVASAVTLILGLLSPWRLCWPGEEQPEAAALVNYLRELYIVGVSESYAANGDLNQARERLGALGKDDLAAAVTELAISYVDNEQDAQATRRLIILAQALGAEDPLMAQFMVATAPTPTSTQTSTPTSTATPSPTSVPTSTPQPTATNTRLAVAPATATATSLPAQPTPRPREWDLRLDYFWPTVRMEEMQAASGQWYWRLVKVVWDEQCGGRHHIYVEVLDENGNRSFGERVVIEYGGAPHPEPYPQPDKLVEEYAFNYPMNELLGAYNIYVDGDPSDKMYGLGLGTRTDPYRKHHTCFSLTFQRTRQL